MLMTVDQIKSEFPKISSETETRKFEANDSRYKKIVIAAGVLTGVAILTALAVMVVALVIMSTPFGAPALAVIGATGVNVIIGIGIGISAVGFVSALTIGFMNNYRKAMILRAVRETITRLDGLDTKVQSSYTGNYDFSRIVTKMRPNTILTTGDIDAYNAIIKSSFQQLFKKGYQDLRSIKTEIVDGDLNSARNSAVALISRNTNLYNKIVEYCLLLAAASAEAE